MSAPATAPLHPWQELLDQLTGRMQIAHAFGVEEDAKAAPWDRVTWIPGIPSAEPARFSIPGAEIVEVAVCRFAVLVYAGSFLEVWQRGVELLGWLDALAGPRLGDYGDPEATPPNPPRPGYDARIAGKPTAGGDLPAGTWRLEMEAALKSFVVRAFNPPRAITSASVRVDAADGAGADQALPNLNG
jgi:hypothetical protein